MFSDLVGSTALSARMDPEDLREVISAYQKCVAVTVQRFGGFVAKYMGDGVLVYFGYPLAHEDDVERAVRAGLELIQAVGGLKSRAPLQTRVGIGTGLVVVGHLIGSGAAQEQAVVGETPNLAARLQAVATPGTIAIDQTTRRLLGGLFEYRDLGGIEAKGFANRVSAYEVVRPSMVESRFEALRTATTPLVGRDEEVDLLLRRWGQAKRGEGCVVLISGEPGIGKSRIAQTVVERISAEPHTRLRYFCSPHHQDSALYPSIAQLERAAGFRREDTAEQRLAKLEAVLAQGTNDLSEAVPLLADLVSIPTGDRYTPLNLTPQKRKEKTLHALMAQLEGLAARQPVLIVWEDLHWSDPTTRESLDLLVDRVPMLRVLVILTFRPEFTPPWIGRPHVTMLTLNRLPRRQGAEMIAYVTGGKALPKEILDQIVDRTDGVPLFIEELTKTVVESGIVTEAGDHYALAGSMAPLAIPTSLNASLLARLDRLAPTREVAQIGAVLGRSFSYGLISAVAGMPQQKLEEALDQLASAELIFWRGTPPDAEYTFKHALVRDAAYSTLLRSNRQLLHARIAEVVEQRFPELTAREPELLAHHFTEARQIERAIDYWLKAGERAAERSANLEAIRHLSRGLEALNTFPESPERDRRELAFQIAIGTPLIAVHGYSASQTGAAYNRARVLCERLGEAEPLVATLSGEFVYYFVRGDYPMMRRLSDEARQVSERMPDPMVRLASHRLAGITAMHFGMFPKARCEFETILRLYEPCQHRRNPMHYVHDPEVSALTYLAPVLWILGFPEQARRSSNAAFHCAAELDQANLTAHVHNFAGAGLDELLGDVPGVRAHAEAIIELADRHSLGYWRVNGEILRGWAMVQQGAAEEGVVLMCRNAADRAALGVSWYQPRYLSMLAVAYAQVGQAESGLRVIADAKNLVASNDEHMWEGELARIEGELLRVQDGSTCEIEACFERAMAITRTQGARSLELRAAISMARLWRDQGKRDEARELLALVYGWFTEGVDTLDLKEAKALLDELSS
jgi:predicted ATPase/class 3 adenylate cyclase